MTPTELKALRFGDEVLLRAKIHASIDSDDEVGVSFARRLAGGVSIGYIDASAIHSLAPPIPRPLAVGDRVETHGGVRGEIVAIGPTTVCLRLGARDLYVCAIAGVERV